MTKLCTSNACKYLTFVWWILLCFQFLINLILQAIIFVFSRANFHSFLSWQFQFSTANNRIRYYPSVPWNYDCVRLLRTWDPPSKAKKWVEGTKNNALTENNKANCCTNTTLGIQSLIWSLLRESKDGAGGTKLHSRCYWFAFISYSQHYAW